LMVSCAYIECAQLEHFLSDGIVGIPIWGEQ
jgi:hypothetical protein